MPLRAIVRCLTLSVQGVHRGYIGMLAVDAAYRKRAIGSTLVLKTVDAMKSRGVDEVYAGA